jgi:hypothetical protein
MDPTSFRFFLTMPGDSRLVGVIREVSTHAGSYAKLSTDETGAFVERVADATASAIAATGVQDAPIEFRFFRSAGVLRVTISWRSGNGEDRCDVEQTTSA